MLFDDGIQVKGQKGTRQPKAKPGVELESKSADKSKTSAVITDIVILQKASKEFAYIAAPINEVGGDLRAFS